MYKKLFIGFISVLTLSTQLRAQDIDMPGQSFINRYSVSQAFAGFNGNTEAFAGFRQYMTGIEGAYKTMRFDFNGNFMDNMGYGFNINQEKSGNFSNTTAALTYAYHINLGNQLGLSLALSPMLVRSAYDLSSANTFGANTDPVFQNQSGFSATGFDAGFGLVFNWTNLFFSVDIPRIICSDLKYQNGIYNYDRTFKGALSYIYDAGSFSIEPMAKVSFKQKGDLNYAACVAAKYNQRIWAEISYLNHGTFAIGVGGAVNDRILLNYQYETGTGDLAKSSNGTHEISIGFLVKKSETRKMPDYFPIPEDQINSKNEYDKAEEKLNQEIKKRESEIKRLEKLINTLKTQQQTTSQVDTNNDNTTQNQQTTNNTESTTTPPKNDNKKWLDPIRGISISFSTTGYTLNKSSLPELGIYISTMKIVEDVNLKIIVFADNQGGKDADLLLAQKRADAIKSYIVSKGIAADRLFTEAHNSNIANNSELRFVANEVQFSWDKTFTYDNSQIAKLQ